LCFASGLYCRIRGGGISIEGRECEAEAKAGRLYETSYTDLVPAFVYSLLLCVMIAFFDLHCNRYMLRAEHKTLLEHNSSVCDLKR
jgi:hypothetical protein